MNQNYPNPFNPTTNISFSIPKASMVELRIFNISGQEVEVLIASHLNPGSYTVTWDASKMASGVYIYQLRYHQNSISKKMLLLK